MNLLFAALMLTAPIPPIEARGVPVSPLTSLAGEWRVAGIDGKPAGGMAGLALRADKREIWWDPSCAGYVRSYRIRTMRFSAGPSAYFRSGARGAPPPLICLIAPPREVVDIFEAIDAAKLIRRTAGNGIEISGGGHSLLLFSQ